MFAPEITYEWSCLDTDLCDAKCLACGDDPQPGQIVMVLICRMAVRLPCRSRTQCSELHTVLITSVCRHRCRVESESSDRFSRCRQWGAGARLIAGVSAYTTSCGAIVAKLLDTPYLICVVPPLHSECSRKRLVVSGGSYVSEDLRRHTTAWLQPHRSTRAAPDRTLSPRSHEVATISAPARLKTRRAAYCNPRDEASAL